MEEHQFRLLCSPFSGNSIQLLPNNHVHLRQQHQFRLPELSFSEFPASLAGATFQPPPPPQVEVEQAEPQPGFSIELDSSSLVNVQELPPVAAVGGGGGGEEGLGSGGSNSGSKSRPKRNAPECIPEAEDIDITTMDSAPLADVSATPAATDLLPPPPPPSSSSAKRQRGRPRGSVTKNRSAPNAVTAPVRIKVPGVMNASDVQMHKFLVNPGEDLLGKLIAFAEHGNRNFYIGSHYGAVSKATLCEPSSTGTRTYEGFYRLISFSGCLIQSEAPDGKKAWTGGLTVTLLGVDNSIIVGSVAGPVIAASTMQVIVCTFVLPKEEEFDPATVNTVNTTKTNGSAVAGDGAGTLNVDNSGGDVSESGGGGGVAVGGDVAVGGSGGGGADVAVGYGARMSVTDDFGMWKGVIDPDTGSFMEQEY